jgi:hypothetical protein
LFDQKLAYYVCVFGRKMILLKKKWKYYSANMMGNLNEVSKLHYKWDVNVELGDFPLVWSVSWMHSKFRTWNYHSWQQWGASFWLKKYKFEKLSSLLMFKNYKLIVPHDLFNKTIMKSKLFPLTEQKLSVSVWKTHKMEA